MATSPEKYNIIIVMSITKQTNNYHDARRRLANVECLGALQPEEAYTVLTVSSLLEAPF
jgi:hypothetical protein